MTLGEVILARIGRLSIMSHRHSFADGASESAKKFGSFDANNGRHRRLRMIIFCLGVFFVRTTLVAGESIRLTLITTQSFTSVRYSRRMGFKNGLIRGLSSVSQSPYAFVWAEKNFNTNRVLDFFDL